MDTREQILRASGLFAKLDKAHIEPLLRSITEMTVSAGEVIVNEGEQADACYVLKEGVCQVYTDDDEGNEIILARLEPPMYFGEQAILFEIPGMRNASVRAVVDTLLFNIPHQSFYKVLELDTHLSEKLQRIGHQQFLENLLARSTTYHLKEQVNRLYHNDVRGNVFQFIDKYEGMDSITTRFELKDGRIVFISRVIGENILSITHREMKDTETVKYSPETEVIRELFIHNNHLRGAIIYGEWDQLSLMIKYIFDQTSFTAQDISYFRINGEFPKPIQPTAPDPETIICNCMFINHGEIQSCIDTGVSEVDEIGDLVGAGTVCGTCVPILQEMLGHNVWQAVQINTMTKQTPMIRSYKIIPSDNQLLNSFEPGQYIVVQGKIKDDWVQRSYSLSCAADNCKEYEIAVKQEEKGLFSTWLFEHKQEYPLLKISQPLGQFICDFNETHPAVCLVAGIGVTPAVSFARTSQTQNSSRPLYINYSAHSLEDMAYKEELEEIANLSSLIELDILITADRGRLTETELDDIIARFADAEFFICGPQAYEQWVVNHLKNSGIPLEKIKIEQFTPANANY